MKIILHLTLLLGSTALVCQCAGPSLEPTRGPKRDIRLSVGQVWRGTAINGSLSAEFDLMMDYVDGGGGFRGFCRVSEPLYGSGKVRGQVVGPRITFSVTPAATDEFQHHYSGVRSDVIRGSGSVYFKSGKPQQLSFVIAESKSNQSGFLSAYERRVGVEKKVVIEHREDQRKLALARAAAPVVIRQGDGGGTSNSWRGPNLMESMRRDQQDFEQSRQTQALEDQARAQQRQADALEQMRFEQSMRNFR